MAVAVVAVWTIVSVEKTKRKKRSKISDKALLLYFSGRAFCILYRIHTQNDKKHHKTMQYQLKTIKIFRIYEVCIFLKELCCCMADIMLYFILI